MSAPNHTDKTFYIQSVKVNGANVLMESHELRRHQNGRIDYILKKMNQ